MMSLTAIVLHQQGFIRGLAPANRERVAHLRIAGRHIPSLHMRKSRRDPRRFAARPGLGLALMFRVPSDSEEMNMNKIRRAQLGFAAIVLAGGLRLGRGRSGQASAARLPRRRTSRRRRRLTQPRRRLTRLRRPATKMASKKIEGELLSVDDATKTLSIRTKDGSEVKVALQRADPDHRRHRSGSGPRHGRRLEGEGRDERRRRLGDCHEDHRGSQGQEIARRVRRCRVWNTEVPPGGACADSRRLLALLYCTSSINLHSSGVPCTESKAFLLFSVTLSRRYPIVVDDAYADVPESAHRRGLQGQCRDRY